MVGLLAPLTCCAIALLAGPEPLVVEPPATSRILLNSGMGLYGQAGRGGPPPANLAVDSWWREAVDIVYFRPCWGHLEPDGPTGMEAWFDAMFATWHEQLGLRLAFRVMSQSLHSDLAFSTPQWVFERGVPQVTHRGLYVAEQHNPVFWDDRYLDEACAFVARLGAVLDGRPGLEFVDIGQIGEWGEMHLGLHIGGRWTREQMAATGYSEEAYIAAYRRLIDAYAAAFRQTPVFLNVGGYGQLNDYAARRGIHFRQDGLTPTGPSNNVGEVYFRPYAPMGILTNYEFHSGYNEMVKKNWDLATTLRVGLSVPLNYLNTNLFGLTRLAEAPAEARDLLLDAARRIGYRFGLERVETVAAARLRPGLPSRVPVRLNWVNRGIGWCPDSLAVELALLDAAGQPVVQERQYPAWPTTRWEPGGTAVTDHLLILPPGTAAGTWDLAVRLVLPERQSRAFQLDLEPLPGDGGWHRLTRLDGVAAEALEPLVLAVDFRTDDHGFTPSEGIALTLVDDPERGRCLQVAGRQEGSWGWCSRRIAILPHARYRLTVQLKIDSLEPTGSRVAFKAGLNGAERWLENHTTNVYDQAALGSWQRLSVEFDVPADAVTCDLSLEKGGREAMAGELRLGEVRLELLAAP